MQYIKLTNDKWAVIDGESTEVVSVSETQQKLEQTQANLAASAELLEAEQAKVVPTDGLTGKQLEAVGAFNNSLLVYSHTQEVERYTAEITQLQDLLENTNG